MKNIIIILFNLIFLLSCGLNARFNGPNLIHEGSTISADEALKDKQVAFVKANDKEQCQNPIYSLLNFNNIFYIDANGLIKIKNDFPLEGSYGIEVSISCDGESYTQTVDVIIIAANIPRTPWLRQIGVDTALAQSYSAAQLDACYGMTTDRLGNVYCGGYTYSSLSDINAGGADAVIVKLNPMGEVLWTFQMGSTNALAIGGSAVGDDFCLDVAVDQNDNVYCTGWTSGALGDTNAGSDDIFVMKLSSTGEFLWLTQFGTNTMVSFGGSAAAQDWARGIEVDSQGNPYIIGNTESNLGEVNAGSRDAYIAKLNPLGDILWIKQIGATTILEIPGGVATGFDYCTSAVAIDDMDNIYCAGGTNAALGGEPFGGVRDAFILKVNSSGVFQWLRQLGQTSAGLLGVDSSNWQACRGIAIDSGGNVICAGETRGNLVEPHGGGTNDAFLMKISSAGVFAWARQFGATSATLLSGSASGDDRCYGGVSVDSEDNIYCMGATTSSLGETNGGMQDAFILKLSPSGVFVWARQLGQTTSALLGYDVTNNEYCNGGFVDKADNIFCSGVTYSSVNEAQAGAGDILIMKLSPNGDFL